jgi:hypothetical protein
MVNVVARVSLDNTVQAGTVTHEELLAAVTAAIGSHPGVAQQIRDPLNDKLLITELTMPEAAAAAATAAINANPGVAKVKVAAPQLSLDDLLDSGGIEYAGVLATSENGGVRVDAGHLIIVENGANRLGLAYSLDGAVNLYEDGAESLSGSPIIIRFLNRPTSPENGNVLSDLTVPSATLLKLHLSGALELALVRTNDIVVPAPTPTNGSYKEYYVAQDGKLYLAATVVNGSLVGPYRTYDQATSYPA